MTEKAPKTCDLCGIAVDVEEFELWTTQGRKQFCCEGCKGIYLMLNDAIIVEPPKDKDDSPH